LIPTASDLETSCRTNLANLATSLQNNPQTNILIVGHTDNTGTDEYNHGSFCTQGRSVKSYISANNVANSRLSTSGKGESEPIADNTTVDGRSQNRRVEIVIVANDAMKNQAKQAWKLIYRSVNS
jgi:outer membrane protein OmpA-like peptidoglycan-associated protein